MVLDGNFSAQHRHMRRPEDDVALADGHAFMVEDAPYKDHLKSAAEYKEVRGVFTCTTSAYLSAKTNTCNEHRAVLTAGMERAKLESTGIGAAACSRHGFFCPHACVDFQLGERSVVSSTSLRHALTESTGSLPGAVIWTTSYIGSSLS